MFDRLCRPHKGSYTICDNSQALSRDQYRPSLVIAHRNQGKSTASRRHLRQSSGFKADVMTQCYGSFLTRSLGMQNQLLCCEAQQNFSKQSDVLNILTWQSVSSICCSASSTSALSSA